ncbi:DUF1064 domain-containing protein [uncultured Duncaniella sp.]|uniref:DUF1064 domain-containing protein n=1 Tax=uncultured Duncaniella sp. TaxID=2768039 RepID=UPI0025B1C985|nr:DUF1064 domain-containing protein [uncultured Duncaniella sp.]
MRNYIDQLMKLTGGKSSGGYHVKRGKGKNKYNAQKIGGYDSKKEYRRACLLKALLRSGEISDLREQVKYVLIPSQRDSSGNLIEKECSYYADFVYRDKEGNLVVEDTKGVRTSEYRLKKKLMLQVHGIQITEI